MLILLNGWSTSTLTKCTEKKLDRNSTRMQRVILNKSWKQHPTKIQLYGHLFPISKTIQVRWTRHAEHSWRSKNELISDVLQWTSSHGRASVGRPTGTSLQQLRRDTGCSLEFLPEVMDDINEWRKRVREIRASSTTRCRWRYIYIYIYSVIHRQTISLYHNSSVWLDT